MGQHYCYENCLTDLGCKVYHLPTEPDIPDSVFVEDTAIVLDETAIITRPKTATRRSEIPPIITALKPYRRLAYIEQPGTIEGGDVLRIGRKLYVGLSSRTNKAGIDQLHAFVADFGYSIETVEVKHCLHLKTAVTQVAENMLLINRDWVNATAFSDMELIDVEPSEPFGGNALLVNQTIIYPLIYPKTLERLRDHQLKVKPVAFSELAKAEAGLTCCSLIFTA
ncbi:MAG: arginine deiminase family protein [Chloroflexota bacterium]|nr:arginine deiminase family protein [Chloroflexota bacterium]